MNKFYMNGKLTHKASDHNTKRCEVEKWVFLPHSDFERLKANPYQEHEAITAVKDLMYEDKNAYHYMSDDPRPIPPGTIGEVVGVDDAGQVMTKWSNGSSLSVIPSVDSFHVVQQTEDEEPEIEESQGMSIDL